MGAQIGCLAREKEVSSLPTCLGRDRGLTQANLKAAGLEASPKSRAFSDFESCWSRETSPTDLTEGDETEAGDESSSDGSWPAASDSASWPDSPDAAEYDCSCCSLSFVPRSGPKGWAVLTVAFKPVAMKPRAFEEALNLLVELTREHVHSDFVAIFDVSQLAVPSAFDIPRFLGSLKTQVSHFDCWRVYQQGFAVVRGESSLFNAVVSAFGALSNAKSKPIFGKDRAEVLAQLVAAFQ